jgi:hypothetical protein
MAAPRAGHRSRRAGRRRFRILYSPAVTMAAIAACSAQNPVPEPVPMHTPENKAPASVTSADATSPSMRPSTVCGLSTASSAAIRVSWKVTFTRWKLSARSRPHQIICARRATCPRASSACRMADPAHFLRICRRLHRHRQPGRLISTALARPDRHSALVRCRARPPEIGMFWSVCDIIAI